MPSDDPRFPLFSQPWDLLSTGALFSLFSRSYPGPSSWDNRNEDHLGIVAYPRNPQSSSINYYLPEIYIGGEGMGDDQ